MRLSPTVLLLLSMTIACGGEDDKGSDPATTAADTDVDTDTDTDTDSDTDADTDIDNGLSPVAVDDVETLDEGGEVLIDIAANDTDEDGDLNIGSAAVVSDPQNGSLQFNAQGFAGYRHDGGETIEDSFTYTIFDDNNNVSNVATVDITINPINDPPDAFDDTFAVVDEGGMVNIDVLFNDIDVDDAIDPATIVITSYPTSGSVVVVGDGTVDYTHNGAETLQDTFSYTVNDTLGATSANALVNVTVTPTNDDPNAVNDIMTGHRGRTTNMDLAVNDTDPDDGLDLTGISISTFPSNGTLLINADGTVDYTHDGSMILVDSFNYTIDDLAGATSNIAIVDITIDLLAEGTGDLYAVREADDMLVHIDPALFTLSDVGGLGVTFDRGELAFDSLDGTLYMLDGNAGTNLYTVSTNTGAATLVGSHGIANMVSMTYDSLNDVLYASDAVGDLYTLDRTSGAATFVGAASLNDGSLAYNANTDELLMTGSDGSVFIVDRAFGWIVSTPHIGAIALGNHGSVYDLTRDYLWSMGDGGTLEVRDGLINYERTEHLSSLGDHQGLAFDDAPQMVGQFEVDDGDSWTTNPPVYNCLEACALLFGGAAADYECSTSALLIDNQAHTTTWGVGGCGPHAEDYSLGVTYDCGAPSCSTSAYVQDNCAGAAGTNYCWQ